MSKRKIIIFSLLILVLTVGVLGFLGKIKIPGLTYGPKSQFRTEVERNLSPEEKKIYLDRLTEGQKALANLSKSIPNFNQEKARIYSYLAKVYFGLGELAKSQENFEQALKLTPNDPNIWTGLYTTKLDREDFAGARKAIEKAKELNSKDADVWKKFIELRRNNFNSDFPDQNGLFNDALVATGNHQDILVGYANYLEANGKFKEAVKEWQKAVELYPDNESFKQELKRVEALVK